jgi:hypothetical protein
MSGRGGDELYAFTHLDKTAGRTVRAVLRRSFGTAHCEIRTPYARRAADREDRSVHVTASDLHRVRRVYRRLRSIAGHNVKPYSDLARECPQVRYFTFLRDPVQRYLSHYKNRALAYDRADFDRWAALEPMRDFQTRTLAGEANLQKAIDIAGQRIGFVGLTEAFDESLLLLGQWLGDPDYRPEYRPVNRLADKTRANDTARARADLGYLDTPEVRDRLLELNSLDQQLYDFMVREHFARQRQSYAGDLAADVAALRLRNEQVTDWREPLSSRLLRNYVYKPALLLRLA